MPHQVIIKPSDHSFVCTEGSTVLEAALHAGLLIPYGCRNGACGTCKGKLLGGVIDYGESQPGTLTEEEKEEGFALFCVATPKSDLTIQCSEVRRAGDIVIRKLPSRVEKIEKPAPDVAILYLKLPANERLQYLAGQYIDILLKDGRRRSFSLANAPHDDALLQLHVRHAPSGAFSTVVFQQMKGREILRFDGPHGTFYLREESDKPIIFLAGGTGFAPIKAIIEHAFYVQSDRPMVLYWGARSLIDLYLPQLASQWERDHDNFTFIPVLSDATTSDQWRGREGLVHKAVMEDFKDLSGYQIYACGAPAMIDAARKDFTQQRNMVAEEFFADSFTLAAPSDRPAQ